MNKDNLETLDYIIDRLEDIYKKVKDENNNFAITALIAYGEEDENGVQAKGYNTSFGNVGIAAFANAEAINNSMDIEDKLYLLSTMMK